VAAPLSRLGRRDWCAAAICVSRGYLRSIQSSSGDATNIELKVATITPKVMMMAKGG
jgi:hypothetical protein